MVVSIEKSQPQLTRDEAGTLFGQTMGLVAVTAGAFTLGAYLFRDVSAGWSWLFFLAAFAVLLAMSGAVRRSEQWSVGLLFGFGFLLGAAVASTLAYYASADPQTLWDAGGATALFVAGFGALGYGARRDLSSLARGLTWALLGLIVFGIVAIFAQIPNGSVIYAVLGLVIFAGLIAFDFQQLRRSKDLRSAPLLAASIFLDILNVFLFFVSFGGEE
jgi:FtsH-binding integral membrane protein